MIWIIRLVRFSDWGSRIKTTNPKRRVFTWRFTIACSRVIIGATRVVTLTYRSQITATIKIISYTAAVHRDDGVAKYFAGNPAVSGFRGCLRFAILRIQERGREGVFTLTTAEHAMIYRAMMDGNICILIYVAVLAAAIDRTVNSRFISSSFSSSNGDLGRSNIGQLGLHITLIGDVAFAYFHRTTGSTEHMPTLSVTFTYTYDGTSLDGNTCQTSVAVGELVWPAETEVIIRLLAIGGSGFMYIIIEIIATSVLFVKVIKISDGTHRTHSTGSIDIVNHMTTVDSDCGIPLNDTSQVIVLVALAISESTA